MDAQHFKAPYLRRKDIWKHADELRERLLPGGTLPVPVLDLAEFDLGLELDPRANLRRTGDIEALLLGDLKTIVVDRDVFIDRRAENRLRFSVAHEIGHLILHGELYRTLRHANLEGWRQFIKNIPEREKLWVKISSGGAECGSRCLKILLEMSDFQLAVRFSGRAKHAKHAVVWRFVVVMITMTNMLLSLIQRLRGRPLRSATAVKGHTVVDGGNSDTIEPCTATTVLFCC
jgi:hypothetical protein